MSGNPYSTRIEIRGTFAVVSSSHWLATQVGMSILERGGNAYDAAVAIAFTLQVVEPHQCGLGGEAVIMLAPARAETPFVVCGQGVSPKAASVERFLDMGVELIPGTGVLSAVVPGAFDAWMLVLRDYGSMDLSTVLEPAICYASKGYPITAEATQEIRKASELFRTDWLTSAPIYLSHNEVPKTGQLFANKALGQTYERILSEASSAGNDRIAQIERARISFYEGFVAERIDAFVRRTVSLHNTGGRFRGLLSGEDMADWRATYEKPAHYRFHNYDLFKPSSWSQGPAFLQMMALLRDSDILGCDPLGAAFVHQIIEATKLAFADREAWYGESSQTPCPIEILLSEDYNKARRKLIGDTAAAHVEPGHPNDRVPKMPKFVIGSARQRSEAPRSELPAKVDGDTCHIDVIDRWGNVVAATPSGGWLQGSPVIPELGMTLNTRAQMLWVQPGLPSSLAPRVRPRTTLSPTMAFRSDGYRLAFGSRGADHQDQWIAEFFLRHIGFDLQAAVDAPMFQTDHWPKSEFPRNAYPRRVTLDHTYEPAVVKSLEEAGHAIHFDGQRKWGRNCAAAKDGALLLAAGSSSVRQTFAAGR